MKDIEINSNDLRVIKTIQNIEISFISLLEEYDFSQITVQKILDAAQINRKTFYHYYQDKYDLAKKIINQSIESLLLEIELKQNTLTSLNDFVGFVFSLFYKEKSKFLALWNVRTNEVDFYSMLFNIMKDRYEKEVTKIKKVEKPNDFSAFLAATIMLQSIKYVLESNVEFSTQYVLDSLNEIHSFFTRNIY